MAKTSQVARQQKRRRTVEKHAEKRKALKAVVNSPRSTDEEKLDAFLALQELPRDASPTRVRNRCRLTGRSRAFIRDFELCRNEFRRLASEGQIPGVTKSSW